MFTFILTIVVLFTFISILLCLVLNQKLDGLKNMMDEQFATLHRANNLAVDRHKALLNDIERVHKSITGNAEKLNKIHQYSISNAKDVTEIKKFNTSLSQILEALAKRTQENKDAIDELNRITTNVANISLDLHQMTVAKAKKQKVESKLIIANREENANPQTHTPQIASKKK